MFDVLARFKEFGTAANCDWMADIARKTKVPVRSDGRRVERISPLLPVGPTLAKKGRKDKPTKLRQKDRYAQWTVKFTKTKPREDGMMPPVDLAIPLFGYQNHVSIDRGIGFIRRWTATDAAAYEAAVCAKAFSTRSIRQADSGPIPPTDRRLTRRF